ncbi:MAG: hypothetical protein RL328_2684 [Acidobacteriota bacterium]
MKRCVAGISVFFVLFAVALISQTTPGRASITGTVVDPAGAVIAGAAVEVKSPSTGATWQAATSAAGQYTIGNLSAGEYELSVRVAGFKNYTRTGLHLLKDSDTVRVDVVLEVGSTSESITVIDSVSLLRTETASAMQLRPGVMPRLAMGQIAADRYSGPRGRRSDRPLSPGAEEYGRYVENEFTTPQKDPLSTFAADVDTASYSNTRRFLNDGQLPPPDSVRVEELINYFSYDYPLPERGKPVAVTTNLMRSPWNSDRLLLHVGLRTAPVATEDLPPSHLTFLIDVSGSMNEPDKLPLVQQALQMLVRQLRPQDTVSLVVYAGAAGVVLPPTSGREQQRILEAIGRLQAGGSTHGSAGIRLAYRMARDSFSKQSNNRVILATDGDFNVGVQSDDELVRLIEEERKSGVFLSVLGFGTGNLKDSKMEKLADHGNGTYAYIDSLSEARKVFVQEMGATLVTVAKDVKLQIEFNPARVKEYRLVGYENRLLNPEDFNDDRKDAGDLGAGHQVTAFYEIVPTGGSSGGDVDPLRYQQQDRSKNGSRPAELAWVKMRYKAPQGDRSELMEWPAASAVADFRSAPRDVRFAAAVAEYGLLLRHSKFAGQASFEHVIATAADALGPDLQGYRTDFVDLARKASVLSGARISRR